MMNQVIKQLEEAIQFAYRKRNRHMYDLNKQPPKNKRLMGQYLQKKSKPLQSISYYMLEYINTQNILTWQYKNHGYVD